MKPHNKAFVRGDCIGLGVFLIGVGLTYAGHRLRTWGRP